MKIKDMNEDQKTKVKNYKGSKRCNKTLLCCNCFLCSDKKINEFTCVAIQMHEYPEFKIDMRRVR